MKRKSIEKTLEEKPEKLREKSIEDLLRELEAKSKTLTSDQRRRLRAILDSGLTENALIRQLNPDLLRLMLSELGTSYARTLSQLSRQTKRTIDAIFAKAIQQRDCAFLTDRGLSCDKIPMDSPI